MVCTTNDRKTFLCAGSTLAQAASTSGKLVRRSALAALDIAASRSSSFRQLVSSTFLELTYRNNSRFQNNCFSVLRSGSKEVTYLRLGDICVTHL